MPNGFSTMTRAQLPSRALFKPASFRFFRIGLELVRRDREIKKPIAARAAFLVDFVEALRQTLVTGCDRANSL